MRNTIGFLFAILIGTPLLFGYFYVKNSNYQEPKFDDSTITPTIKDFVKKSNLSSPTPTTYQKQYVYSPTSTPDPDPIINCTSKTGTKRVRLSVCKSYTDCPDGNGGYIFEPLTTCTARWEAYKQKLTKSAQDYANALIEQQQLSHQLNQLQYGYNIYQPNVNYDVETNYPSSMTLNELFPNPTSSPTPMKTSTGEVLNPPY